MIVVDASVAVKWILTEEDREQALAILESPARLTAPSVLQLEVSGAILRHYREGILSEPKAHSAYELWSEILARGTVRLIPWESLYERAVDVAFAIKHTVHDSLYVAAALQTNGQLITADDKLQKRGSKALADIQLLKHLPLTNLH